MPAYLQSLASVVVFFLHIVKQLAHLVILFLKDPHSLHHLLRQCEHFLMVLRLRYLSPSQVHYLKHTVKALLVSYIHIHIRCPSP